MSEIDHEIKEVTLSGNTFRALFEITGDILHLNSRGYSGSISIAEEIRRQVCEKVVSMISQEVATKYTTEVLKSISEKELCNAVLLRAARVIQEGN